MVTFLYDFTAARSESSHYLHFYTLRHFTADLQLPLKVLLTRPSIQKIYPYAVGRTVGVIIFLSLLRPSLNMYPALI